MKTTPVLDMTWDEIKKKLKNEMPVQVLADLNGMGIKTFRKLVSELEEEHGEKILPEQKQRGRPRTKTPGRTTQYRRKAEAKKEEAPAPEPEELPKMQPQMIEIDAGVADVIETNIDDLRDLIQKKLDEIEMLKYQLRSWEDILKICVINPDTIKASDELPIPFDMNAPEVY